MSNKWDDIYRQKAGAEPHPCWVLGEYEHLLPATGRALDLACGQGGNACLLAKKGLDTHAWDLSEVAVDQLRAFALEGNWPLQAERRDVEIMPPSIESFDVIVVANFLHRPTLPLLRDALREGGLLYYQTHTRLRPAGVSGPGNPDFLLEPGELLQVFAGMNWLAYREEGLVGDTQFGKRGMAAMVAQKWT